MVRYASSTPFVPVIISLGASMYELIVILLPRARRRAVPSPLLGDDDVEDCLHVGARVFRCLVRRATVLTGVHVGGVPVPPVVRRSCLLERVVVERGLV